MKTNNILALAKTSNSGIFSEGMSANNLKEKNIIKFIRIIIKY